METKDKKFNYQDYSPREQWEKFGICAAHFYPFENQGMDSYGEINGLSEDEYSEHLKAYLCSTVYKEIRYFFKDYQKLKEFCEMVEV